MIGIMMFIYIFGGTRWAAVEISHDKPDISPAPPRIGGAINTICDSVWKLGYKKNTSNAVMLL